MTTEREREDNQLAEKRRINRGKEIAGKIAVAIEATVHDVGHAVLEFIDAGIAADEIWPIVESTLSPESREAIKRYTQLKTITEMIHRDDAQPAVQAVHFDVEVTDEQHRALALRDLNRDPKYRMIIRLLERAKPMEGATGPQTPAIEVQLRLRSGFQAVGSFAAGVEADGPGMFRLLCVGRQGTDTMLAEHHFHFEEIEYISTLQKIEEVPQRPSSIFMG